MSTTFLACGLCVAAIALAAPAARAAPLADRQQIKVWPGGPQGSARFDAPQAVVERSRDPAVRDRAAFAITSPDLLAYRPARPNGTALLVLPGGAYARVVVDKEAEEIAPALTDAGLTVFRLLYRLPGQGQATDAPLADAQRAIRLIRANAAEWGLDPARVGVLGFSAGGHLAASLATQPDRRAYAPVDAADALSARPDFVALGYPVITMDPENTHAQSRLELLGPAPTAQAVAQHSLERMVGPGTPPAFLFAANDDVDVPVANSLGFFAALGRAKVPAELHLFAQGGHGFSLRFTQGLPAAAWPTLLTGWMRSVKMMP